MLETLIQRLAGLPPEAITFVLGATPVSELRGAIPYALTLGGLTWPIAFLWAVLGNLVPVLPLLYGLEPVSRYLRRWSMWERFFAWLFERTRRRGRVVERYRALGLMLFVSIPLPVTGAWTGCAAAFLFGIRPRYALPAVIAGVLLSGTIVTLSMLGIIGGLRLFTR